MPIQVESLPAPFVKKMQHQLKDAFPDFIKSLQEQPPVSIRLNPRKEFHVANTTPVPWTTHGRYLPERPVFTLDPAFHGGAYYVQEASSMFLEQAIKQCVDVSQSLYVLDLCAAPGGKSTHLASLINPESLLVSNEVIRSRASILSENIQKWGSNNVVVTNNDPEDFKRLPGFFDVMVIDAPCSGEGLFRKDADAMHEWSEDNVMLCSKRQRRIVSDVWSSLKGNGILIYSTCTYNPEENEENLQWLKQERDVEFLKLKVDDTWGAVEVEQDGITGYHFYPHKVKGEGFFISVIRKKESEETLRIKNARSNFQSPSKKILEQLQHWVADAGNIAFIQREDLVQFFPTTLSQAIDLLAKNLRLVSAGTFAATVKHDKLIPEHAMALSVKLNRDHFPVLDLNVDDALRYLRKETLSVTPDRTGFTLVRYQNIPIGWGNVLPNRINNLYPAEWRIRMAQ
jgi:16S rRNA C967 or C1407 C5-methylase (RsmB/RsmF family)/NOL1/NOP2/fmu family ribosome biogenesis protein